MPHTDAGWVCLVAHFYANKLQPQCIHCLVCKEYIRPEDMHKDCIPFGDVEIEAIPVVCKTTTLRANNPGANPGITTIS